MSASIKKPEQTTAKSIVKELTAEQTADRKQVNELINLMVKAEAEFILHRLALAFLLITLRKKYKERFWDVVDTSKISRKTLERAMKLVLKDESVFPDAMSNKGGAKDIAENVELLVIDERVKALDKKALSNMYQPTLNKIRDMKNLSDEDWAIVIGGRDKPFKEYKKKKAEEAADEKEAEEKEKTKNLLAQKPKNMAETVFLAYINTKDKLVAINRIAVLEDMLSKNGLSLPEEDSELGAMPLVINLAVKTESEKA